MTRESITAGELKDSPAETIVVDIRKNPDDRRIPNSIRVEGANDDALVSSLANGNKERAVVLYCGSGNTCSRVAAALRERGYNARALAGGYKAWVDSGLPTQPRDET